MSLDFGFNFENLQFFKIIRERERFYHIYFWLKIEKMMQDMSVRVKEMLNTFL